MMSTRNAWIAIEPQPSTEVLSLLGCMSVLQGQGR